MNKDDVITAVQSSLTKTECLVRMGLERSTQNYKELSDIIKKFGIDDRHLQGIKASYYLSMMR